MIFKSIRWRLQIWYGGLLFVALAGLGITAYQLERNRQMRAVDEQLQNRLSSLAHALQMNGPRHPPRGEDFPDQPPPPEDPADDPPPGNFRPRNFKLPTATVALFGGPSPSYYYFIRRRDGTVLSVSTNLSPDRLKFSADELPPNSLVRESKMTTPPGEVLLVGRSIAPDLAELKHFALALAGMGGVVLLLGLAGGWILASRAIRPIADISATAVKIAGGELSRRIDVADTDNELGRLASVLNSTFARLEAAFAQQGQFTADAAHELRTPVSVILMQTQTALKHDRSSSEYRATVEACERAAQRMRRLLESLLELTRLDAGQEPMKRLRFDLAETVADCVALVQPLAAERNVKMVSDLPTLNVTGDPERLAQVFINLLTNAIFYNHERGEVRVKIEEQKGTALISVADTGQGISEKDLPHVFERFYRADQARSGAGCNGLGLSISKAIVEAHGGTIAVTSELKKGSIFTVRLPLPDVKS